MTQPKAGHGDSRCDPHNLVVHLGVDNKAILEGIPTAQRCAEEVA